MNSKSLCKENKPQTKFNTMNLYRWFKQQGSKEKSPMEKPYLAEDQKKGHKEWRVREKERMAQYADKFYA